MEKGISNGTVIKATPITNREKKNVLTAGEGWEVGKDIEAGSYVVSITPGSEKNMYEHSYNPRVIINTGTHTGFTTEYRNDEWDKSNLKTFSVNLSEGTKIDIDFVPSLTFTKKL